MSSNRSNELPDKQAISLAFLEQTSVYLHLDPRRAGVHVPVAFAKQPQLVLQVGLNMPVPIADLRVDDAGISCTLSFNRSPHYCVIPWSAIFAMVGENGRGMVWPDDVPAEVAAQVNPEAPKPKAPSAPGLKSVPDPKPVEQSRTAKARTSPRRKKSESAKQPAGAPSELSATAISAKPRPKRAAKPPPETQQAPAPPPAKRQLPPYLRIIK